MKKKKNSYTVYFAGELFSMKHLIGNAWLAEAIYERSHGKYRCLLPQDFKWNGRGARSIRDDNLRALIACDLALFNYDGPELDSGTVVEFMFAKFADLPSVLLRTDLRTSGDWRPEPWNLMTSFFPRTATVIAPTLTDYRKHVSGRRRRLDDAVHLAGQHSSATAQLVCERVAAQCVRALDRVVALRPALPKFLREEVYHWLSRLPALGGKEKEIRREFERYLTRKVERGLL
jgi:nucleoside 2-deoxyribosyltransferase